MELPNVLNEERLSFPDKAAKDYIDDILRICRNATLDAQEEEFLPTDEDTTDNTLQFIIDNLETDPEFLVSTGLLAPDVLEDSEDELYQSSIEELALRLHDEWLKSEMKMRDEASSVFDYDEYDGVSDDDRDHIDWFDERVSVVSELLLEAKEALELAEADRLVQAIDELFDQVQDEVEEIKDEELATVENWAQLLVKPGFYSNESDDQSKRIQKQILQAIKDLATRLCEIVAHNNNALEHIEWRHLEEVIATALSGIGFDVTLTPPSKDGGKDVIASCILHGRKLVFYVEVKHWRSGKKVNSRSVYDFVQINVNSFTDGGLFLSTSGYDKQVLSYLSELHRTNIRLGDDTKVIALCQHFSRRRQGIWIPENSLPGILFENTVGSKQFSLAAKTVFT